MWLKRMNHSLKVQHEKKYFVALLYQHKKKTKKINNRINNKLDLTSCFPKCAKNFTHHFLSQRLE